MINAISTLTSTEILNLSTRAIIGASISLVLLFVITSLFRKNVQLQRLLFIIVLAVILFATTVLFTTALIHIQDIFANLTNSGLMKL